MDIFITSKRHSPLLPTEHAKLTTTPILQQLYHCSPAKQFLFLFSHPDIPKMALLQHVYCLQRGNILSHNFQTCLWTKRKETGSMAQFEVNPEAISSCGPIVNACQAHL